METWQPKGLRRSQGLTTGPSVSRRWEERQFPMSSFDVIKSRGASEQNLRIGSAIMYVPCPCAAL